MRLQFVLCVLMASLLTSLTSLSVCAQVPAGAKNAGIEELKQEMGDSAGDVVPAAVTPAAPVAAEAAAPVIEELVPAPAKPETEKKPVVEKKPEAPVIEELTPALVAPIKPDVKPEAKPEVKPEAAPEVIPAAPEAAKVAAPVAEPVPDAATKEALDAAIRNLGSDDRIKLGTSVAQQEEVRRKAREIEGRRAIDLADKAWKADNYSEALEQYRAAFTKLPIVPPCMMLRNHAAQRIPECEYQVIRALAKEGKDADALAKGDEFIRIHPNNIPLKNLLTKLREQPTDITTKGGEETDVQKQMRLGKEHMARREYAPSRACFESVLGLDPDNREAMRYLKVLGDREYSNKTVERDATVRKMTAEVRDTWNSKYRVIKGHEGSVPDKPVTGPNPLEEKMKKIVIDEIEFRQANMHDVVDFLTKRSRECDKTTEDETKKGVNIILNLGSGSGGGSAPAEKKAGADDVFGAPAEGDKAGGGSSAGEPEVTFSARYITLHNALKIITSLKGLKWRIDGDVVMIVPFDWDPGSMEMRMYPVEPTFIERVKQASTEMPTVTRIGSRDKEQMDTGGGVGEAVPSDLKAYFENMGVKFPKGSSITYNSAIGKVIVANTSDNLATFERILAELNVVPKQVEIEARFVEVNETDLYEAGLEWMLTDNWEMLMKNNANPYSPLTSNPRIQMNAGTSDGGITKGLRFYGTDSNAKNVPQGGGQGSLGAIASFASVLTNPDLTAVLHALEQNGNADLLSAPKVTTRSGAEATIKVVTEYIYPTSFEVQGGQMQSSFNQNQQVGGIVQETTVLPQDFSTREVGVILNVLPEVSPDGNMINLTMKPQVVTDPIWYQYGSTVRRADGSEQVLNMPQPFFQVRTLETQISIYDGATVVMGGLITESVEKTNDKIPLLGDIPLIGALFRSKSEQSIKKNLLIFVTAKLVDPAGHLIRTQDADIAKPVPAVPSGAVPPSLVPTASVK